MGRPPKIQREQVLRKAMNCFWKHGYRGTSIDDLVQATGLLRGSLYLLFTDKNELFLEVLKFYRDEIVLSRRHLVDTAPSARRGIELFFEETLKVNEIHDNYWGCLNTNTAAQINASDGVDVSEWMQNGVTGWESYWTKVVARGLKDGSIKADQRTKDIAISLVALTQGSNILLKNLNNPAASRRAIKTILNGILGRATKKAPGTFGAGGALTIY